MPWIRFWKNEDETERTCLSHTVMLLRVRDRESELELKSQGQLEAMRAEDVQEGHHCEIPQNYLEEPEADNDWAYQSLIDEDFNE